MVSIISVFPPYRGGIATFSDYLYRSLKEHTEVEALNFTHLYPSLLFPGKTQFDTTKMETDYAHRVLHAWNPLNWKSAADQILGSNPDHILFSYWHPFFAPAFLRIIHHINRAAPDIDIHILAHNVMPHENFLFGATLSKKLLDSADSVILLSQKSLDEASTLNLESNIRVLFHPVYQQPFPSKTKQELREKYGFSEDDFIPLFFGLVRPYKGLDLFIDALNTLDLVKKKIKPLIAGEFYTEKGPLISQIKDDHKAHYSIIDRFVSDEEMAELFTLSDILVMPYRSATQSGILANAINFHLPSVITDLKGLTEHVEHRKTAWIVSQNDTIELAEAIISLKNYETNSAIKEALIPLKKELSWDSFSRQLLSEISKENS